MKKIQYVRILKCSKEKDVDIWYRNAIGGIFPVEDGKSRWYVTEGLCGGILKKDCEPVKIKELDKDCDGNYLECGDYVTVLDDYDKKYFGSGDRWEYIAREKTGRYIVRSRNDSKVMYFLNIRKIPKEEKKVDPIEEVYNEDRENGFSWEFTYAEKLIKKYRRAALQHMEDKKK